MVRRLIYEIRELLILVGMVKVENFHGGGYVGLVLRNFHGIKEG